MHTTAAQGATGRAAPARTALLRGQAPGAGAARMRSSATPARHARRWRRRGTHNSFKTLLLPSESGSAFTSVEEIRLPCTAILVACGSARREALTVRSGRASRPPSAAPRARCWTPTCAPQCDRRAIPPSLSTPRRPSSRARTRGLAGHCRDQPRRAQTPGAGAGAARTQGSPAPTRHASKRRRRGTHSFFMSGHLPSDSGSAFTFVKEMSLPRTARACGRAHVKRCACRVCVCTHVHT
jgi:hypothetical protein